MSASVVAPKLAPLGPEYDAWRVRIFASTWLCYAGFYFCRHAFSIVKATLGEEMNLGPSDLANIWAVYLVAYAIGEFNSAALGSKTGARRLLLLGMGVSLGCNVVFGFANNVWTFTAFMFLNGLAQATGWSGNVGTMAHWFRREERGRVMGFWSTCYQIGGVLAKAFAAMMLGYAGWRWSFWGASMVLAAVWVTFYVLQRNRPEDVGLAPLEDGGAPQGSGKLEEARDPGWTRELVTTIVMMGAFYFFVKYIRYALWSWAPYFLQLNFQVPKDQAGYYSTAFDACGFLGAITAGWLSDRVFNRKRALVALIMVVGLAASTGFLAVVGAQSIALFTVSLGLMGFMLFGPDSLISGAGAIDVGSRKRAIAAAGIINGMGSCGSVIQELVIGNLYQRDAKDLTPIFVALMISATAATVLIAALVVRARQGKCNL